MAYDANTTGAGSTSAVPDPQTKSADYQCQTETWRMIQDILEGVEAMRGATYGGSVGNPIVGTNVPQQVFDRARGIEATSPYLPRYPNEPQDEYDRRRRNAFLTNVYKDISENLASKPFAKECQLDPKTGDDLKKLAEDIDGLGNNLHVFASHIFKSAMNKGNSWILCDYTTVPQGVTLADERALGARAYWVHIPVEKLLAVYSKFLNGKEVIFHARIDEPCTELSGYDEKVTKRVRQFDRQPILDEYGNVIDFEPATWAVFQEETNTHYSDDRDKVGKQVTEWVKIASGNVTIGIIPLVPVVLGERDGTTWKVAPPLKDLAYMQVKLFQMESNLDYTKELTAFPMLTGIGVTQSTDANGVKMTVPVGPRAVLFGGSDGQGHPGSWAFIEPSGSSLTFLQAGIDHHKTEMRDLGMQPLSAANLTVVTTANLSMKASSACQAWALKLKDALEQAWKITVMWLNQKVEPVVNVYDDFGSMLEIGPELVALGNAEAAGVISARLNFNELKRRGVLSDEADWDKDQEEQAKQHSNDILKPESHIDPKTGMPIVVQPKPGVLNPPTPPPPPRFVPNKKVA